MHHKHGGIPDKQTNDAMLSALLGEMPYGLSKGMNYIIMTPK
jgi:hypothetical protein